MSRNIRRKSPAPVQKAKKRRGSDTSSSLDLSGEEGYSGVDEISDDEDDEEDDVDAAEEENILAHGGRSSPVAPRPQFFLEEEGDEEEEEDEDDDEDDGYHYNYDDDDHDDDEGSPANDDGDSTSWAGIQSDKDASPSDQFDDHFRDADYGASAKVDRHVRFDLPDRVNTDDDLSTDDDYAGMYTDIFIEQKHLDPAFRREVENDPDESSGSGSFWDYADQADFDNDTVKNDFDDESTNATPRPISYEGAFMNSELQPDPFEKLGELSAPSELDGYETDGETTDEDVPEPIIRRKTRRPSVSVSEVTDSEADTSTRNERGQPRVGRFRLDKCHKKPTVVLNPVTRKLMILTPHNRRQLDLSPEHFHDLPMFPMDEPTSPMLSNSANMMISAMSMFSANAFADFVNGQAVAEPEAFFADLNNMDDSEASIESHLFFDGGEDDQDDGERNLDLNDFIAFGDDSSEDEDEKTKNQSWEPSSTPARPTTASSDADILSHLNPHTVGAFRRNQVNQQLILSNQATQDSLAFSGPYNHTAIRGLRSDRFDTAGAPLTPVRRRKNQLGDIRRSPLEAMSTKRKASSEAQNGGHKKQRSISDVTNLHI